jgi:hypothetical protein
MMTKTEILALVAEMKAEEKKTQKVPHYYKRNGKMLERSYPDYIYTERYKELAYSATSPLYTEKAFVDAETGKAYTYMELEAWACDFEEDSYISSEEYEEEMGDDL